ncbi:MAG: YdiU family protein [Pseudomonadota bacterium]
MKLNFDNSLAREFPGLCRPSRPAMPSRPRLLLFNAGLADSLSKDAVPTKCSKLTDLLSGQIDFAGSQPVATAYAGHQFGRYASLLGDGRAVLLGEVVTPGEGRIDLQLKGSGTTPFSDGADGKLAIGPALREYVVSEAMHALGVPTTRSLGVALTGDIVERDTDLPGAILARTAKAHLRIGTFQYAAKALGPGETRRLADYAIDRLFPEARACDNPYLALFERVMDAQIETTVKWMSVGFVHGVMNTDNCAITGETLDYGPCAFIDGYSKHARFSSIDVFGRYAFGNQPNICRWNLAKLASALMHAVNSASGDGLARLGGLLEDFPQRYGERWVAAMRAKLGLCTKHDGDITLIKDLFAIMEGEDVDYTTLFRTLADVPLQGAGAVTAMFSNHMPIEHWLENWINRIGQEGQSMVERRAAMNSVNPIYIARNHKVEDALNAAQRGDIKPTKRLLAAVTSPFEGKPDLKEFAKPAPADQGQYVTFCGT